MHQRRLEASPGNTRYSSIDPPDQSRVRRVVRRVPCPSRRQDAHGVAFVKRLFETGVVTRVLFLADRIAVAAQAEDAFTDHLPDDSLPRVAPRAKN